VPNKTYKLTHTFFIYQVQCAKIICIIVATRTPTHSNDYERQQASKQLAKQDKHSTTSNMKDVINASSKESEK
jgi:hypothetical protein